MDENTNSLEGVVADNTAPGGQYATKEDLERIVNELKSSVKEISRRVSQSTTARVISKLEESGLSEKLQRLEELQNDGLTQKQALRQLEMEEKLNAILEALAKRDGAPQEEQPASEEAAKPTNNISAIEMNFIKKLGLDVNSPEVISVMRITDAPERLVAYTKLASTLNVSPNPSMVIPPSQSGESMSGVDLTQKYYEEVKKLRRGDVDGQYKLLKKYRDLAKSTGAKFDL